MAQAVTPQTYLTTDELAAIIKYDARTIRERLKDSVLLEGRHYIRPFGGRKILFIWERIEQDMALLLPLMPTTHSTSSICQPSSNNCLYSSNSSQRHHSLIDPNRMNPALKPARE